MTTIRLAVCTYAQASCCTHGELQCNQLHAAVTYTRYTTQGTSAMQTSLCTMQPGNPTRMLIHSTKKLEWFHSAVYLLQHRMWFVVDHVLYDAVTQATAAKLLNAWTVYLRLILSLLRRPLRLALRLWRRVLVMWIVVGKSRWSDKLLDPVNHNEDLPGKGGLLTFGLLRQLWWDTGRDPATFCGIKSIAQAVFFGTTKMYCTCIT